MDDAVSEGAEGLIADARCLVGILDRCGKPLEESELTVEATMRSAYEMDPERAEVALDHAVAEKGAHRGDRRRVQTGLTTPRLRRSPKSAC